MRIYLSNIALIPIPLYLDLVTLYLLGVHQKPNFTFDEEPKAIPDREVK